MIKYFCDICEDEIGKGWAQKLGSLSLSTKIDRKGKDATAAIFFSSIQLDSRLAVLCPKCLRYVIIKGITDFENEIVRKESASAAASSESGVSQSSSLPGPLQQSPRPDAPKPQSGGPLKPDPDEAP